MVGIDAGFWSGRRVLLTGHTGFKGAWMTRLLRGMGAVVEGLSLPPEGQPNLHDQLGHPSTGIADLRDPAALRARLDAAAPEVVFHMAAQPLVLRGYAEPRPTWETNLMGTVNLLEAIRQAGSEAAVVCITTDKVYDNRDRDHGYGEDDPLGGHDPYSASKAACEIAIASYRKSFFGTGVPALASARAGNVIGGGDWAADRILPDIARALAAGRPVAVRNPAAIRPWQHVLDPLRGYLLLAQKLAAGAPEARTAFNFGPDEAAQRPVRDVVETALAHWPGEWADRSGAPAPHEAARLALNAERADRVLGWQGLWGFEEAIGRTIDWYRAVHDGADPVAVTEDQIAAFLAVAP